MISVKSYLPPPVCRQEIWRYAGGEVTAAEGLLDECLAEIEGRLSYRVCWRETAVHTDGKICRFDGFSVPSASLSAALAGCERAVVFAATLGVELDRLVAKYGRLSPAKAMLLQAIGAERIEALCDTFCAALGGTTRRFSPGYGDLPLSCQRQVFDLLDCSRRIGLSLTDSLLMTPTKSVTAFVGLTDGGIITNPNKCSGCDKADCPFRGDL
ncbi:MAG: Vitamin B12 dependent methionine synthase activation subunit [Clostridia bacterium]|nr:Vitamin B12 dependent methionine synthase activation subunit [Clostridia bacterium]